MLVLCFSLIRYTFTVWVFILGRQESGSYDKYCGSMETPVISTYSQRSLTQRDELQVLR